MEENGTNWAQVARAVVSRNSDQCSSHWSQVIDPSINFADWTAEEDEALLHSVLTHGTNWATIATTHIPKRNSLALKNRYSTLHLKHCNRVKSKQNRSARKSSTSLVSGLNDNTKIYRSRGEKRTSSQAYYSATANEAHKADNEEHGSSDEDNDEEEEDDDGEDEVGDAIFDISSIRSATLSNVTMATGASFRSDKGLPIMDTRDIFAEPSDPTLNSSIQYDRSACFTPAWTDNEMLEAFSEKPASHISSLPSESHRDNELFNTARSWTDPWSTIAAAASPTCCRFNSMTRDFLE